MVVERVGRVLSVQMIIVALFGGLVHSAFNFYTHTMR